MEEKWVYQKCYPQRIRPAEGPSKRWHVHLTTSCAADEVFPDLIAMFGEEGDAVFGMTMTITEAVSHRPAWFSTSPLFRPRLRLAATIENWSRSTMTGGSLSKDLFVLSSINRLNELVGFVMVSLSDS